MNNSLNSLIINKVHVYYVNGVRFTRGHTISLSSRVFRRLITLIKITGKPYNSMHEFHQRREYRIMSMCRNSSNIRNFDRDEYRYMMHYMGDYYG